MTESLIIYLVKSYYCETLVLSYSAKVLQREENLKMSSCILQCIPKYTCSKFTPRHSKTNCPALPYITNVMVLYNTTCTIINISGDNVILPKYRHIGKLIPTIDHSDTSVHTASLSEIAHEINPSTSHADWTQPTDKNQHLRKTCKN